MWSYLSDDSEPCTFSPEPVAESSQIACWDTYPSALLKLMPTAEKCCSPGNVTDTCRDSQYGMTLRRSTGTRGAEGLTWYLGDSPVRTYLPQDGAQEYAASAADCGPSSHGSLAKYNPDSYSWRTSQLCLVEGWAKYSETWPAWGMTLDGELFPLPTAVIPIYERESGSWRVPTIGKNEYKSSSQKRYRGSPDFRGAKMGEGLRDSESDPIYLNPSCAEIMMGWPMRWSDLAPLATDKFHSWLQQHGESLEASK